jgi:uncharacterized protein
MRITALKADGHAYRWWDAEVVESTPACTITINRVGDWIYQPTGDWQGKYHTRNYYWPDKPYNLMELYHADGTRVGVYVHIASKPEIDGDEMRYYDYELDVMKFVGQPARVEDEDEFFEAARKYGYTPEFQAECRRALAEALQLVESWSWTATMPR